MSDPVDGDQPPRELQRGVRLEHPGDQERRQLQAPELEIDPAQRLGFIRQPPGKTARASSTVVEDVG